MLNKALTGRRPNGRHPSAARHVAPHGARGARGIALAAIAASVAGGANAATFSDAVTEEARRLCAAGALDPAGPGGAGCAAFTEFGDAWPVIGSFAIPSGAAAIQERLRTAREAEEGGASADPVADLGKGLSVFASAGVEALNHSNNRYEDGYEAIIPSVTVGIDQQVTKHLVVGAALNYFNFSLDYDEGGDANTNSYGALLYASILPFDGGFIDVTVGYARKDYYRNRNGVIECDCGDIRGNQSGGTDGNEYSAGILLGYDYPIETYTIGPRFSLNYIYNQVDDYNEHGRNGLALGYSGQDVTSLQSGVGILATKVLSTDFGVLVPQVDVNWIHDYAVGGRTIDASFIKATAPSDFSFKTEPVERDFATAGVGLSALLPSGWQPFVSVRTLLFNDNFVSLGGTAGLRVGL